VAKSRPDQIALDPRTKLALAVMGVVLVISAMSLLVLALWGILLLAAIVLLSSLRQYARWLLLVLPMALFFGLVTAWAVDPMSGLMAGGKLLALTTVGHLFFVTTPPEDLANSLIKMGLPYHFAFVVGAGMQFVPVLGRKARQVLDAQQARGIPVKPSWRALRNYPAFLVPLLVQAFQLAEELAEAMETRGFGRPGRSFYENYCLTGRDIAVMLAGMGITILLVWGGRRWL
jgi:energy-coupling factor transport system permease protein